MTTATAGNAATARIAAAGKGTYRIVAGRYARTICAENAEHIGDVVIASTLHTMATEAWGVAPGGGSAAPTPAAADARRGDAVDILYAAAQELFACTAPRAAHTQPDVLRTGDTAWLDTTLDGIARVLHTTATALGAAFWGK